jgi:small subunit ribosomal protein S3e
MKGTDPEGQLGPRKPLPDSVQILEPPLDKIVLEPSSEQREPISITAPPVEEAAPFQAQESYQPEPFEQTVF